MLTKDQILAAVDLKTETVAVPEWDGDVTVSEMSGEMRCEYEDYRDGLPRKADGRTLATTKGLREFAVAVCLVDEEGKRLFDDGTALFGKNAEVIDRLFDVVDRLNKLTNAAVEDAEKNSESDQTSDSGTN